MPAMSQRVVAVENGHLQGNLLRHVSDAMLLFIHMMMHAFICLHGRAAVELSKYIQG